MGSEVEAKYWMRKPTPELSEVLGLESITEYRIKAIRESARKLTGNDPEFHNLRDFVYTKSDLSQGYSKSDLEEKVELRDNRILYEKNALVVRVEKGRKLGEEYEGMMRLLKRYFNRKKRAGKQRGQANKYTIRIREDKTKHTTYLTMKYKHGDADEKSEEYEFIIPSRTEGERFLYALGYEYQNGRTKTKKQESYTLRKNGAVFHIELNRVPGLGTAPFLEIEAVSCSFERSPDINSVYDLANALGIEEPERGRERGGNLETRGYGKLLRLANGDANGKKL